MRKRSRVVADRQIVQDDCTVWVCVFVSQVHFSANAELHFAILVVCSRLHPLGDIAAVQCRGRLPNMSATLPESDLSGVVVRKKHHHHRDNRIPREADFIVLNSRHVTPGLLMLRHC